MRIISLNCNGIRSAYSKGLYTWLSRQRADILCLQETKAQIDQLTEEIRQPKGWHTHFVDAEKKGYSGVAIFSKQKPDRVVRGFGEELFDSEGRYVQADFGDLSVASLYLPSGSSKEERQAFKFKFLDYYLPELIKKRKDKRRYILCGDWNIAHKEIDLKNWRGNRKNSGFLPEEREWMDKLFLQAGYVDGFRVVNQKPDEYTWWSNRGQAWANNVGWRIDYQVISESLTNSVSSASIYKKERFSDHSPLIIDYEI